MQNKTEILNKVDPANDPLTAIDLLIRVLKMDIQHFMNGEPVATIETGLIKRSDEGKVIQQAKDWMRNYLEENRSNGIFNHPQIGEIELTLKGVKDSLSHLSADIHLNALPAVPYVLENSILIEKSLDKDGRNIQNFILAAPVVIGGEKHYTVVRIRKDLSIKNSKPKFYIVAAELEKETKKNAALTIETHSAQKEHIVGSKNRLLKVLHSALNVNNFKIIKGRSNNVKTAKGTKVSTVFAVLEVEEVITSHLISGAVNANYPQELQPRDRTRESSQAWVYKTANAIDPENLGRSGRADTGAPILGDDLVVESGNGRSIALKLAYERNTAADYKEWLIEEAEYFGFKKDEVIEFKQPVLVRIRTSDVDRQQFAIEANQDDKLSFTATEQAKSDAKRLTENLIQLFKPSEDGDLLSLSNQKFIQGFIQSLGDTEAAQYTTTTGKPTQALLLRVKAAVFSKAYDDDRLLEMLADQTKPELQNILNALSVAAPKFIEARAVSRKDVQDVSESIVNGIEQALDQKVSAAILEAANVILKAKHQDQDISEYVKQQGLFNDLSEGVPELAIFLAQNNRSSKKMGIFFRALASFTVKQALDDQNHGLFGEPEPVNIKDAILYATSVLKDSYPESKNISMFDSAFVDDQHKIPSTLYFTAVDIQSHGAATSPFNNLPLPAEEQKKTGEYIKGVLQLNDILIEIENPACSIRTGIDNDGQHWQSKMKHHYGYFVGTKGVDGDEIDVFVKNNLNELPNSAFIIRQTNKDGELDEHKFIIGAGSLDEAKGIYLENYEPGWYGLNNCIEISMFELRKKISLTWDELDLEFSN